MEQLIAKLVQDFEAGRMNRRQLIRALSVTAGAATIGSAHLGAEGTEPLKVAGINHVSYQVADYAKTRDFYSKLFGVTISGDDGKQCTLSLGSVNLVVRNGTGVTPTVDHIAYSIDQWSKDAVLANLTARNFDPKSEGPNSFQVRDPDGYHVQLSPSR